MDKILFINACVRPGSRTLELAEALLHKLKGDVQEIKLYEVHVPALDISGMEKRNRAGRDNDFTDPFFDAAKHGRKTFLGSTRSIDMLHRGWISSALMRKRFCAMRRQPFVAVCVNSITE